MKTVYLNQFEGIDELDKFRNAVNFLKTETDIELKIPAGKYILRDEKAKKLQADVMAGKLGNNPEKEMFNSKAPYTVGLDFSGVRNAVIDGQGAELIVDGFMETLSISNCENVTIRGLSIDHLRKPYSKGVVVGFGADFTDVYFADNRMISIDMPSSRIAIRDRHNHLFNYITGSSEKEQLSDNSIRFYGFCGKNFMGDEIYIWHTFHSRPAILIYEAKNTNLTDITIYSHPGMGIVGHRSDNILLKRLKIIPSVGEGMSTNTDATHFTSCTGLLRFEGCHFEGHGDDATNVHTYYHTITKNNKNLCETTVLAPTGTHCQKLDYPNEGDILELSSKDDLTPNEIFKVIKSKPFPDEWRCELELDKELPEDCTGFYLANTTQLPRLEFIDCFVKNHLARSVLVKTRNVLIEGCSFESNTGTAIHIAAEGAWHEGISAENVCIRNNRMVRCGSQGHGCIRGAGGISINILAPNATKPVHKNIIIENNIIDCPDTPYAIYAANVRGIKIINNKTKSQSEPIFTEYCEDIEIKNN